MRSPGSSIRPRRYPAGLPLRPGRLRRRPRPPGPRPGRQPRPRPAPQPGRRRGRRPGRRPGRQPRPPLRAPDQPTGTPTETPTRDAYPDADRDADPDADRDTDRDADRDADPVGDSDRHGFTGSHVDGDRDGAAVDGWWCRPGRAWRRRPGRAWRRRRAGKHTWCLVLAWVSACPGCAGRRTATARAHRGATSGNGSADGASGQPLLVSRGLASCLPQPVGHALAHGIRSATAGRPAPVGSPTITATKAGVSSPAPGGWFFPVMVGILALAFVLRALLSLGRPQR